MEEKLHETLTQFDMGIARGLNFLYGMVAAPALVLRQIEQRIDGHDVFARKSKELVRAFNRQTFAGAQYHLQHAMRNYVDPEMSHHIKHEAMAVGSTVSFVMAVAGAAYVLYK